MRSQCRRAPPRLQGARRFAARPPQRAVEVRSVSMSRRPGAGQVAHRSPRSRCTSDAAGTGVFSDVGNSVRSPRQVAPVGISPARAGRIARKNWRRGRMWRRNLVSPRGTHRIYVWQIFGRIGAVRGRRRHGSARVAPGRSVRNACGGSRKVARLLPGGTYVSEVARHGPTARMFEVVASSFSCAGRGPELPDAVRVDV